MANLDALLIDTCNHKSKWFAVISYIGHDFPNIRTVKVIIGKPMEICYKILFLLLCLLVYLNILSCVLTYQLKNQK